MSSNSRYLAGAMSGTSADGVDVAITRIDGRGLDMNATLILHHHLPYSAALRAEIFAFRGGDLAGNNFLARLAAMGRAISLTYAAATREALERVGMPARDLAAVAAHGQTLFHDPPSTIQWFDPALLAAEVGCPVISDFRRADLAAGGQGAPLVPFADYILFRHPTTHRVLLNIGGIGNITLLPAGGAFEQVIAFDTGPGNCISDWLMRTRDPSGPGYDSGGQRAVRGKVPEPLASGILSDPFFEKPPPKSTDGPEMIQIFERALGGADHSLDDLLATAAFVTAASIERAIGKVATFHVDQMELIASGGGTQNAAIMGWLRELMRRSTIRTIDELGLKSDAKEALAFALLGAATLDNIPSNVPSVTGARRPVVLGSITPKP